jgi:hypothetical protein
MGFECSERDFDRNKLHFSAMKAGKIFSAAGLTFFKNARVAAYYR